MEQMKVVILCGGKGTRAYPFTEFYPKVMMPVNGTPILVHLMRIYASQGFTRFVLAAGHRQEMLHDYFSGRFPDWSIEIVDTGEDADTGDRIIRCAHHLTETFLATYGDGLGNLDMRELISVHQRSGGLATLTTVPLRSQYGLVVYDANGKVERFQEKPLMESHWINAGFMIFDQAAFQLWHGHNLEQEVLPAIAREGRLYVHLHSGFWKSMDTSKDQQELEKLVKGKNIPWMPVVSEQDLPRLATEVYKVDETITV
jgi:glucose-1-phosphate cytidylyltransferase